MFSEACCGRIEYIIDKAVSFLSCRGSNIPHDFIKDNKLIHFVLP
jgi:hypothetical protein